jgi:hypothetical protein
MIDKPKKERRFLKVLGRVGEILIQEVLLKVGSNLIKRIGGKKTLPSILFLFLSISIFAQFPSTGNKQRLGFQTTADGLVWRGSLSDTAAIQPLNNQNAWVILDTVNLKIYSFDFTSNVWNQLPSGSTVDTTSLSNRINLKLNISDTTAMLLPYAKKSYVDTAGRFYARQDFTNVSSSTLTWTQTDTLVPNGVNVVQVYRNGQILLPTQYTIPTNSSVVIGSTAYKVGENYTVIFPKGGGGSGGSGSGSLTSISGGTGITVSPNPITTTGTVSADLTVLMELSDTVTLSNRINNKVNILDTASMLAPYFRDSDTSSLNLTSRFALKLNSADTASLSSRINTKGTVSSVGSGFGLLGGTITTTGTLRLDSATVFNRIRDSIVDVAIGNDTIKILKQEYAPALTSVLTWTITPKFPIQLKAYILVFRNGQLLNNEQYNLTDTNKITIVSASFKVGANYTVATVSGIGSVGSAQAGNPVYPEAGIALSTGSAWASSITNNSSNWNIAYNDKINNAAFTGTDTKTLTLTQLDGGTLTPTFTDLQGVTGVTAGTGLTGGTITTTGTVAVDFGVVAPLASPTFTGTVSGITKSMVGLGNVDNTSDVNKPVSTATQTALDLKENTISAGTTGQYYRGDKTFQTLDKSAVGLGNVDNTSDANKPVSTATQTTLDLKQNTLNGTGFVKASGTNITYDNSSYLRTGLADSTYLKLTGGTLTGNLSVNGSSTLRFTNIYDKGTYTPFNAGIGEQSILNVGAYLRGGTVMLFPDSNLVSSSANLFLANSNVLGVEYSAFGSGLRNYSKQGGDNRRNSLALYTSDIGQQNTNRIYINYNGDIGINDDTPIYKLDVNGTLGVTGAATLSSTLAVQGDITEGGNNVLTSADTTTMLEPYIERGDTATMLNPYWRSGRFSGTLPIANGGTGAESASVARTTLAVGYVFTEVTAGSSVTLTSNRVSIVNTGGFSTTQLDLTPATNGRMYMIKNLASGTVVSDASNVIPFNGGSAGTAILGAGNVTPQWCTLIADGTNWHIMQRN